MPPTNQYPEARKRKSQAKAKANGANRETAEAERAALVSNHA